MKLKNNKCDCLVNVEKNYCSLIIKLNIGKVIAELAYYLPLNCLNLFYKLLYICYSCKKYCLYRDNTAKYRLYKTNLYCVFYRWWYRKILTIENYRHLKMSDIIYFIIFSREVKCSFWYIYCIYCFVSKMCDFSCALIFLEWSFFTNCYNFQKQIAFLFKTRRIFHFTSLRHL